MKQPPPETAGAVGYAHHSMTSPPFHQQPTASAASEPGLPPPENRVFYPALDGMRAVAVLMVFYQHYSSVWHPATEWGWTGVEFFFVLSGFLITGILYDTRNDPHRVRNFYMRRVLRIFPLYYGVFLAIALTRPFMHWAHNPVGWTWLTYLGNYARFFYVGSPLLAYGVIEHLVVSPVGPDSFRIYLGHFWSLCVEEQFYLVWPAVVFAVGRRSTLRTICMLSVPICLLLRIAGCLLIPYPLIDAGILMRVTPFRVDAFLIGGLLALVLRGPNAATLLRAARRALPTAAALFVLWLVSYRLLRHTPYIPDITSFGLQTYGLLLVDSFGGLLILNLLSLDNPVARAFNITPLRWLGRISYGVYVFHDMPHRLCELIVVHLFRDHAVRHSGPLVAALALSITLVLSTLSFRFYETPFLRLKSRFTR